MKLKKIYVITDVRNEIRHVSLEHNKVWTEFFTIFGHAYPIAEAIKAYTAIGYRMRSYAIDLDSEGSDVLCK